MVWIEKRYPRKTSTRQDLKEVKEECTQGSPHGVTGSIFVDGKKKHNDKLTNAHVSLLVIIIMPVEKRINQTLRIFELNGTHTD